MSQRNESLVVAMQTLGQSVPPVFLVPQYLRSCNTMSEQALDFHVAPNLGHQGGIGDGGYMWERSL